MKKNLVFGLIICLIMSTALSVPGYSTYDPLKPILGVIADGEIQIVEAGTPGTYELKVKNASSIVAQSVRVSIQGSHPFRSDVGNLTKTISYINPNQTHTFPFTVNVSPVADSKVYEFDVLIEYKNYDDTGYSVTEKAYVKVNNKNIEPIVGIVEGKSVTSPINTDEPNTIMLNLVNKGTVSAKDLRVKVSGFSNQGLILYKDVDTKSLEKLDSKETKVMYFNVIPGNDAVKGTTPINVNVSYIDDFGGKYTKDYVVYMTLSGKKDVSSELEIQNLSKPTQINSNQDFSVTFDVVNTGSVAISSTEIEFAYPTEFISKSNSKVYIKNLAVGEKKSITFQMMAKKETTTENYHSYINVSYKTTSSQEVPSTLKEYIGLYVVGDSEKSEGSKPKLIIENYNYGGEYVYAGQNYFLEMSIKNTSTASGTRNIKVTLSSEDNVFTPVDSSSSFFIPAIGPGEVYNHRIELKTKIDSSVKIYALTTKMAYEDSKGNAYDQNKVPYEETEVLSIAVAQPVRLETADMMIPFENYVGQPFYIEQEFYNMGKSTMYNMMVKLDGIESAEGTYFVGNFEAGRSDRFSAQVFGNEPGTFEGKLIYTFEDALGTVSTVEQPISYTVVEMAFPDPNGGEFPIEPIEPEPTEGSGKLLPIGIGVLALILVFLFLFLRKRKKLKLARELEALDE